MGVWAKDTVSRPADDLARHEPGENAEDDLSGAGNSTPYLLSCAVLDGFLPLMYLSYHAR